VIIKNLISDRIINNEQGTSKITVETGTITKVFTPGLGAYRVTSRGVGRMKVLNETDFIIDFNHPLAGETIVFTVTVESIEKGE
jgi:FKBP-type peptidyl-prolyl cis-trans isomerase 2